MDIVWQLGVLGQSVLGASGVFQQIYVIPGIHVIPRISLDHLVINAVKAVFPLACWVGSLAPLWWLFCYFHRSLLCLLQGCLGACVGRVIYSTINLGFDSQTAILFLNTRWISGIPCGIKYLWNCSFCRYKLKQLESWHWGKTMRQVTDSKSYLQVKSLLMSQLQGALNSISIYNWWANRNFRSNRRDFPHRIWRVGA